MVMVIVAGRHPQPSNAAGRQGTLNPPPPPARPRLSSSRGLAQSSGGSRLRGGSGSGSPAAGKTIFTGTAPVQQLPHLHRRRLDRHHRPRSGQHVGRRQKAPAMALTTFIHGVDHRPDKYIAKATRRASCPRLR